MRIKAEDTWEEVKELNDLVRHLFSSLLIVLLAAEFQLQLSKLQSTNLKIDEVYSAMIKKWELKITNKSIEFLRISTKRNSSCIVGKS